MPTYAFIRGWIHTGRDLSDQVREIVESSLAQSHEFGINREYAKQLLVCWHFPTTSVEDFVLLGATVGVAVVPLFKTQLEQIAKEVIDLDGEDAYNICGRIEITVEGEKENQEWTISSGKLDTTARRPYFISP